MRLWELLKLIEIIQLIAIDLFNWFNGQEDYQDHWKSTIFRFPAHFAVQNLIAEDSSVKSDRFFELNHFKDFKLFKFKFNSKKNEDQKCIN